MDEASRTGPSPGAGIVPGLCKSNSQQDLVQWEGRRLIRISKSRRNQASSQCSTHESNVPVTDACTFRNDKPGSTMIFYSDLP